MKEIFFSFLSFFFSFHFLNVLQSDNNSNTVYVLGHKYILGPSQGSLNPRFTARAKMSLSGAQNMFMPANINSIVLFECLFIENDGLQNSPRLVSC